MKNPIQVFVGSLDLAAVHSVTQRIFMVNEDEKIDMVSSISKVLMCFLTFLKNKNFETISFQSIMFCLHK